jgi:CRP-like cAMP-binding protein
LPKTAVYKANSVVYFQGDVDERIYILNSGRVVLRSKDIEDGRDVQDLIQTGEFFGVKSALGHYPREEDAVVLTNSQVIQFTVSEFEQLASSNTRIILKMLKVFSNQLRRIHSKVSSMLNQQDEIDPEVGLTNSANYYFRNRNFDFAAYIYGRYLELYPNGRFTVEAKTQLERARKGSAAQDTRREETLRTESRGTLSDVGKEYYEAESLFANGRYDEAINAFRQIAKKSGDSEYTLKARIQIGHVLYEKGEYADTIRHYSQLIQEMPKLPQIGEVLFYIGAGYGKNGDEVKARAFLEKALARAGDDATLRRKISKSITEFGG